MARVVPRASPSASADEDVSTAEGMSARIGRVLGGPAPEAGSFEELSQAILLAERFAASTSADVIPDAAAIESTERVVRALFSVLPWLSRSELAMAEGRGDFGAPIEKFTELRRSCLRTLSSLLKSLSGAYGRLAES